MKRIILSIAVIFALASCDSNPNSYQKVAIIHEDNSIDTVHLAFYKELYINYNENLTDGNLNTMATNVKSFSIIPEEKTK